MFLCHSRSGQLVPVQIPTITRARMLLWPALSRANMMVDDQSTFLFDERGPRLEATVTAYQTGRDQGPSGYYCNWTLYIRAA